MQEFRKKDTTINFVIVVAIAAAKTSLKVLFRDLKSNNIDIPKIIILYVLKLVIVDLNS